ncbi:wax ester/triacylglycerol synthase domain-containing protein [Nonomuraea purpurea]|uniref:Wax ester/triacylglycerol synthase domain-containing protein n=1 Tax=Nonomuraea purpurea TaxID=1849276 RepID=A0ABV8GU74_9ACTN
MTCAVPLAYLDQIMWYGGERMERPSQIVTGCAAVMPGPAPDRERLRRFLAEGAVRAPVLTYRLARTRWEPDPAFDPDQHLGYVRAQAGRTLDDALLDLWEQPLPRERPLWDLQVLHGHRDDEHVLCYRSHHAFQDGVSVLMCLQALMNGRTLPAPKPWPSPPAWSALTSTWHVLWSLAQLARPQPRWRPARGRTAPPATLRRVTALPAAHYRRIAAATGAGSTQVDLAVLAGALRTWQPQYWNPPLSRLHRRGLTVGVPISLHRRGHPDGLGNHVGAVPVTLPCAEPSPARRLRLIMAQFTPERVACAVRRQAGVPTLPRALLPLAWACVRRRFDNVPTFTFMPGSSVLPPEARDGFALLPRPSFMSMAVQFTHLRDTVNVVSVLDAGIPRAEDVPHLLRAAFEDLRDAV